MDKKKKVIIAIVAVVVVLVVVYIVAIITGNVSTTNNSSSQSQSEPLSQLSQYRWDISSDSTAEAGTSERIDDIAAKAKETAQNIDEDSANILFDEAIQYIQTHQDNLFESNEVMENVMYYGSFLYQYIEQESPANNISELPDAVRTAYEIGWDSWKVTKDAYRGLLNENDDSMADSVEKLKENLNKFD